jgi:hypothetical protein
MYLVQDLLEVLSLFKEVERSQGIVGHFQRWRFVQ